MHYFMPKITDLILLKYSSLTDMYHIFKIPLRKKTVVEKRRPEFQTKLIHILS